MAITAGTKVAKPQSAKYIKSKKGTEGIQVTFSFVEPSTGSHETLPWTGWLTAKAIDKTKETLVLTLGCNGTYMQKSDDGTFTNPEFLFWNREVKIVVELEARTDEHGAAKTHRDGTPIFDPRIKWVNPLGGGGYIGCAAEEVGPGLSQLIAEHSVPAPVEVPF